MAMINIITEDLIQYVYGETSHQQNEAIQKAVQSNWELNEDLEVLRDTKQQLDEIIESPRRESIMAILDYAKSTSKGARF